MGAARSVGTGIVAGRLGVTDAAIAEINRLVKGKIKEVGSCDL